VVDETSLAFRFGNVSIRRGAVLALTATGVVTLNPALLLDIGGGLAFGLWEGTLYILLASMLGATAEFYIARGLERSFSAGM
jgi:uncharacterized membrane protein YdjX (TVP38/TMEM64 family)